MVIRVAVIGCGAAGLCALRHLTARPAVFEAMGFDIQSAVGGTWKYTDRVGTDKYGQPIQSSMYRNLRTNLPKEVMAFPGFPFKSNLPSFISHQDVLKYLEDYYHHYNLQQYVKFETKVDHVEPVVNDANTEWRVSYSKLDNTVVETRLFDAVMVCNGHYTIPLIPTIEGMDVFKGTVIHSHVYRLPDPFKDKTVVCLGAAASGQDVSLDIASVAKKVILSHSKPPIQSRLLSNMCQQPGIDRLTADSVVFKNGVEEKIDALVLTTGYRFSFPFLNQVCSVNIEDERVTPLYKHIIHTKFPTLSFIGICKTICPFPQFENQVRFVVSTLDKTQALPSQSDMEADIECDFKARLSEGLPARHAHTMGPRQWAYNDSLAELGKFEAIPPAVQILYDEVHRMRVLDLPGYKSKQYRLTGTDNFEEIIES